MKTMTYEDVRIQETGIFRLTPKGSSKSEMVNPLSAITTSLWEIGKLSNSDLTVNSLSEILPA